MNQHIRQRIENKEQGMQYGSPLNVLKNMNDLEGFEQKELHRSLKKKAEKLSIAVYMVTGFLSDNEPIKWQARECGLNILSDISLLENKIVSERERHTKSMSAEVGRIISLLEITVMAGFISKMNCVILKEEYQMLANGAQQQKTDASRESYVFSRDFFSSSEHPLTDKTADEDKGQKSVSFHGSFIKQDTLSDKMVRHERKVAVRSSESNPRRETILRVIKDKKNSSIKDVLGHISGCGEKTIQREITALVEEGVLRKTGERRWSRYSIM